MTTAEIIAALTVLLAKLRDESLPHPYRVGQADAHVERLIERLRTKL